MENIKEIKKGTKISNKLTSEASLYLYNNTLYKIFNNNIQNIEEKEDVLNTLYKYPIDGCSKIYSLLYDGDLIGYGMEYYDDFTTLKKVKKIPLELKKEYSHKLIGLYKKLKEVGYIYYDFHEQNILVNKNDLKLIDIDSCLYNSRENDIIGTRFLNELILSMVFDCVFFECQIYYMKSDRKRIFDILYSGLSYEYGEKGSLNELDEYIENIDKKMIKEFKKQLPKNMLK